MYLFILTLASARAGDADPPASPPPDPAAVEARLQALEAEIASLKSQLDQNALDDLMRDAEALAAAPPPPQKPPNTPRNIMNPRITAIGDVFASVGVQNGHLNQHSGPWARSLELDIREVVDPYAKAVAVLALEQEDPLESEPDDIGAFNVEPEELYVDIVALPKGLSARVGRFRQHFGLANRTHPHDLPWTDQPMVVTSLLGEEGYNDTGVMMAWRPPSRSLGVTFEGAVLSGQPFDEASETATPAWLGRGELFRTFGKLDLGLGASGAGLRAHAVGGGDLMVRYRVSQWRSIVLMAEGMGDESGNVGGYAGLQLQPTRPLYLGIRGDYVAFAEGESQTRLAGFVSYYTSEFLRIRAGVSGSSGDVRADTQLTFVWGSHPAEPYWVNR